MPENNWEEIISTATEDVLEKMFFAGIYGPAQGDEEAAPRLTARLGFTGSPSGVLTLSISAPLAEALAVNFLALEPDQTLSSTQIGGVVCELANMICGSLLSRLESSQHFRLSSPELLSATPDPAPGAHNQAFDLGDGTLSLSLAMEEHAA